MNWALGQVETVKLALVRAHQGTCGACSTRASRSSASATCVWACHAETVPRPPKGHADAAGARATLAPVKPVRMCIIALIRGLRLPHLRSRSRALRCALTRAVCVCTGRYSYVAVVDSVQWRVRLVVLVQETNAQLHQLVQQRGQAT